MKEKESPSIDHYHYNSLLEEYKMLRTEILKKQDARLQIFGVTMAAIGVVLGLILREPVSVERELNWYTLALISFALIILNAALILTIHYTQQIQLISTYLQKFIEPKIGIKWETRWTRYRKLKKSSSKLAGLPLGTSKPLAFFYALMTSAVYSLTFVTNLYIYPLALVLVSVIAIFSFAFSYDLYHQKSKGWRINWDILDA